MKYLFLIIRHLFPRKKWRLKHSVPYRIKKVAACGTVTEDIRGTEFYYEDQFGNVKKERIQA